MYKCIVAFVRFIGVGSFTVYKLKCIFALKFNAEIYETVEHTVIAVWLVCLCIGGTGVL